MGVSCGTVIDVVHGVADGDSVGDFARVMVDAFATESINAYAFDFTRGHTWAARCRTARIEVDSALQRGDYLVLARERDRIAGGAIVSRNVPVPVRVQAAYAMRWLWAVLPLLPTVRWRRLASVKRAIRLTRPPYGAYYTLVALAVHPEHQGRRLGHALLHEVHRLSERDPEAIGVYLFTGGEKNRRMYEGAGYRTIETRRAGSLSVYHMFRTNGGCAGPCAD